MAKWFRVLDFNVVTWIQIPLWPLAGVAWFNSLVILVKSQLVCFPSVGFHISANFDSSAMLVNS